MAPHSTQPPWSTVVLSTASAARNSISWRFTTSTPPSARNGQWLAIPTENAPLRSGRGGVRRAWPSETKLQLQFLRIEPNRAVLLTKGRRPRVLYILVRKVELAKRLDIAHAHSRASRRLFREFPRQLARQDRRLERKWR